MQGNVIKLRELYFYESGVNASMEMHKSSEMKM